jgi:hypothetical protein
VRAVAAPPLSLHYEPAVSREQERESNPPCSKSCWLLLINIFDFAFVKVDYVAIV